MSIQSIVIFVVVLAIFLLILKLIGKSAKMIIGFLVNAIVGFLVLTILNFVPGIDINVGWISSAIVGLLGVPGLILVLILQLVFKLPL